MAETEIVVDRYTVRGLTAQTWPAFEEFAERHNGVWGGCWCTWFHPECAERKELGNRGYKRKLVDDGHAHAALVFDGDSVVAWCQYGTVEELPNIYHRKEWLAGVEQLPDFRLTCLFVGRGLRRHGLASTAVRGALALIAQAGGGRVETYPQDLSTPKKVSASFLYNGTRGMFEKLGFTYERPKGKGNCVMSIDVAPA